MRFRVKADDYVAAENGLEAGANPPRAGDEIHLTKSNQPLQGVLNLKQALAFASAPKAVPAGKGVHLFALKIPFGVAKPTAFRIGVLNPSTWVQGRTVLEQDADE